MAATRHLGKPGAARRIGMAWLAELGRAAAPERHGARRQPRSEFALAARVAASGRRSRLPPGVCCLGSPSHTAPASFSISPPNVSRSGGRAAAPGARCVAFAVLLRRRAVALRGGARGCLPSPRALPLRRSKTALIAHPVLRYPASGVTIAGFVELREESQHTDRFVLRVEHIEGESASTTSRSACGSRSSAAWRRAPGAFHRGKGAARTAAAAARSPGSYDFARDLYFQRIGASGFVMARSRSPRRRRRPVRCSAPMPSCRGCATPSTHAFAPSLPGDPGAIAAMLINGRRDAIDPHLYDAMFVSGIGHVLSISGYHMAVVAGVIFFIFRALLALDSRPCRPCADQKMGRLRRPRRRRRFICCCRAPSRDATLLHHDRGRAHRRPARPADLDHARADLGGADRAVLRARSGRASELPDVLCRDAGA